MFEKIKNVFTKNKSQMNQFNPKSTLTQSENVTYTFMSDFNGDAYTLKNIKVFYCIYSGNIQ